MFGLTKEELTVLRRLDTPRKIQDFINTLAVNFEPHGETCMSPRRVLHERTAHCMEGAMFGAAALYIHGQRPLVMDLKTSLWADDTDHVVAVFQKNGFWGALSKTNHAVLRYREPIYRTIRELALSYFHEYFLDAGQKTLRSYSRPLDLSRFDRKGWITAQEDLFYIPDYLDDTPHTPLLTTAMIKGLRPADPIEIAAGKLVEWAKPGLGTNPQNIKDKRVLKRHIT
ncbi:MAG: hypothetical protein A3C84_00225 [Candidatus Ryanbacteria bacterium RIFCSPHIGHO2_02_FULL_48_12]|uniref:Transglutaminase-like domain-containing protein n=1 Tax=Candidatus Ryanbacteria bacterium RIFCSPHIGHO2_01_FULL_48_27 TaxID=1802115 RepID=A0A1G2G5A7_9BACT|nr:MAG: hypothetical protein A2756_00215 [Candidatus Ryanbacteria bacterium RIFCSPHIGHO2_01_FULL_48_27]OGZ50402.1 MAG: hypothetical protein A3C84_00225 [Candidatus Ryanbacteria bacterium RIFCSPHIGHO2_02_FULL_48_12]